MSDAALIAEELDRVARRLGSESSGAQVERPRDPRHGDWATNLAMVLARELRRKPMDIAAELLADFDKSAARVAEATVAPPGFINFRVDTGTLASRLAEVISADTNYGRNEDGRGESVVVEFVSANPTGPLHVGHGRQAALGDAISELLTWSGWRVSREFYYNDAGVQIEKLGQSVWIRAAQEHGFPGDIPEGGYHGEYIRDLARRLLAESPPVVDAARLAAEAAAVAAGDSAGFDGDTMSRVRGYAIRALREEQDEDLRALGVVFDTYYLESSLYADGRVDGTIGMLNANKQLYERDGALWLRTSGFGDDKDRVARKSDGSYTYFLPDVAYHVTKWERGFRRAINVQGADHHSTVTRVRAGLQALNIGIPDGYPEYVLHQMVTVMASGEEVKISKRAGSYVTVRDLVDWVGRDAVRYFFTMRKGDSHLVFDVDLARSASEENPVYYIQMAHARMCGIFRVGGLDIDSCTGEGNDWSVLDSDEERALVKALLDFPEVVRGGAQSLEPHRIAAWLLETSRKVHLWYHKAHVLLQGDDTRTVALRDARLALARASRIVIRNGLSILGISAPERM